LETKVPSKLIATSITKDESTLKEKKEEYNLNRENKALRETLE